MAVGVHLGNIVLVQRAHAALALHHLHDDRAGGGGHGFEESLVIVGRGVGKALVEGAEVVVEHLLTGGSQGGQGAAVEAVHQADDLIAALAVGVEAVLAGRLHGAFVGLCAGVGKEHLVKAGALAQGFGQLAAGVGVVQVGGVLQSARLLAHSGHPVRVAVAQAVHADAAGEIQIFLAVKIGDVHPFALFQSDLVAAVGVGHMGIVPFNDLLIGHGVSLPGGAPP